MRLFEFSFFILFLKGNLLLAMLSPLHSLLKLIIICLLEITGSKGELKAEILYIFSKSNAL